MRARPVRSNARRGLRAPERAGAADAQLVATIAAIFGAVLCAGIFVYVLTQGPSKRNADTGDVPEIDSFEELGGSQGVVNNLELEFVDKDNPTRKAGVFLARKVDPLPGGESELQSPSAWIYMEDGSFLFLRAPRGFIKQDAQDDIERGRFLSNPKDAPEPDEPQKLVELMLFDATPNGKRPDPNPANATLVGRTSTLTFDLQINEAIAPGPISITSERFDFDGADARVVLNRLAERIDLLEIRGGGSVTVNPDPDAATETAVAADQGMRGPDGPPPPGGVTNLYRPERADPAPQPRVASNARTGDSPAAQPTTPESNEAAVSENETENRTRYQIIALDDIVITRGDSMINADQLEAWMRTIDGELHPDALGLRDLPPLADSEWIAFPTPPEATSLLGAQPNPVPETTPVADPIRRIAFRWVHAVSTRDERPTRVLASDQPSTEQAVPVPDPSTDERAPEPAGPQSVTVAWSGTLTLTPQQGDIAPQLQGRNHLALRLSSPSSGLVTFNDDELGATGRASIVEYAATSQQLTLTGVATGKSVRIDLENDGRIETSRVEVDLREGVAVIPAPGLATQFATQDSALSGSAEDAGSLAPSTPIRTFEWNENARLQLARREGEPVSVIQELELNGRVNATDTSESETRGFTGDKVVASFQPALTDAEQETSFLTRLTVDGEVNASAASDGSMRASGLSLLFDPPVAPGASGNPSAVRLTQATIEREGATIRAETINADLVPDAQGDIALRDVDAFGTVRLDRAEDQLSARADRLTGDPAGEVFVLESFTDEPVLLSRGGATVRAQQLGWDGRTRIANAFGAGDFEQRNPDDPDDAPPTARAQWTDRMVYEDASGRLLAEGDASATWSPEPGTRDTLQGARVEVLFSTEDESSSDNPLAFESGASRQIKSVHTLGQILDEGEGAPAIAEALRESTEPNDEGAFDLLQLLRLEAPEFFADNEAQTLSVNHPGRLLVADLRETSEIIEESVGEDPQEREPAPTPAPDLDAIPDPSEDGSLRGSALFKWNESLLVDRKAGTATITGAVRMTHKRLADAGISTLTCDKLVARISPDPEDENKPVLTGVTATGGVRVLREGKEILADTVVYDAETGILQATANQGAVVSYFDPESGANQTARGFTWNLVTDEIRIFNPGASSTPRP